MAIKVKAEPALKRETVQSFTIVENMFICSSAIVAHRTYPKLTHNASSWSNIKLRKTLSRFFIDKCVFVCRMISASLSWGTAESQLDIRVHACVKLRKYWKTKRSAKSSNNLSRPCRLWVPGRLYYHLLWDKRYKESSHLGKKDISASSALVGDSNHVLYLQCVWVVVHPTCSSANFTILLYCCFVKRVDASPVSRNQLSTKTLSPNLIKVCLGQNRKQSQERTSLRKLMKCVAVFPSCPSM